MSLYNELTKKDIKHLWHPCSQPKDIEIYDKGVVKQAHGNKIFLEDGRNIIDAVSSWWCKTLGHNHPRLKLALKNQADKFEHVMLACLTNETTIGLSEKLTNATNSKLNKVFYASDGANAVEIALKMVFHLRYLKKQEQKNKVLTLKNGYHGETMFTLSASDCTLYKKPYQSIVNNNFEFIDSIPYINAGTDINTGCDIQWEKTKSSLEKIKDSISALLVEPIVQGAGGIKIYSKSYLEKLCQWCRDNDIYIIFDEIMTGFGRTGKMFAYEHMDSNDFAPDFLCLGKGITSGWLALSCVMTKSSIYETFYNCEGSDSFLHSHTYSGNALACAVATETMNIIEDENILDNVKMLENSMLEHMQYLESKTNKIENVRGLGAIVAADIKEEYMKTNAYIYKLSLDSGILLRPMGRTIYWTPPLNTNQSDIGQIQKRTMQVLQSL